MTSSSYKYDMLAEILDFPMQWMSMEIEEIQGNKEEIVQRKLESVIHLLTESTMVIVDDTSIHLRGLSGRPGQYAKEFLEMGMMNVVDIASKVGTECRHSTIYGVAYMQDGKVVTRMFEGSALGDIRLEYDVEPKSFLDIFVAQEDERANSPFSDGMIGRSRAAKKMEEHLIETGIRELLSGPTTPWPPKGCQQVPEEHFEPHDFH